MDFLRYYAAQVAAWSAETHRPLGAVVCISPWNFPLAIFSGQVAAALAAGNAVLAKPAEQTPLTAAAATTLLHQAGIPRAALQLLPGDGTIGAALVANPNCRGVLFTGSTEVARAIQQTLARRLSATGQPIPLIAETGGMNAMIVDSSALTEQVVADVVASAFDSAGQRCSALRILCLQHEIADRTLAMLRGALDQLALGNPDRLATDIGPVIDAEARAGIEAHVAAMAGRGFPITRLTLPEATSHGTFVAPTLIEINHIADVPREVFGPVLHVLRYNREELPALLAAIAATGYGLTFGLHTRIDETIARTTARAHAGNLYINRNMIGAVVGVQPFGGEGLSGTGPKAGGPLYLNRLVTGADANLPPGTPPAPAIDFAAWAAAQGDADMAPQLQTLIARTALGSEILLPGPVGERNLYTLHPLGTVLCLTTTLSGLITAIGAALATGNTLLLPQAAPILPNLPASVASQITRLPDWRCAATLDAVLFEGDADVLLQTQADLFARPGPLPRLQGGPTAHTDWRLDWLLRERTTTTNTAAAGGNASLMTIG